MADTSVVDLDTDFMCLGRCDLDILNGEVLASFPGNRCLCHSQHPALLRSSARRRYPFRNHAIHHLALLRIRTPSPACGHRSSDGRARGKCNAARQARRRVERTLQVIVCSGRCQLKFNAPFNCSCSQLDCPTYLSNSIRGHCCCVCAVNFNGVSQGRCLNRMAEDK